MLILFGVIVQFNDVFAGATILFLGLTARIGCGIGATIRLATECQRQEVKHIRAEKTAPLDAHLQAA